MCLKSLTFFFSFFFYAFMRSIYQIKHLLLHSSRELHHPKNRDRSPYRRIQYDAYLLKNKSFSDVTRILFTPINQGLRLFNGAISARWTLMPNHVVQSTENSLSAKTSFLLDGLKFNYEGLLKFMHFDFGFKTTVHFENVNFFTDLSITSQGSKTIVNNIYIGSMKLKLNAFNHTLCNETHYFGLSRLIEIVLFFISCLVEFSIRSHLNTEFKNIDEFKPAYKPCFKSALADYIERTETVKSSAPDILFFNDENSPITKSFISVLHDILVGENRKTLVPILQGILNPELEMFPAERKDEGQVSDHNTESEYASELESSSEHNPNDHESNEAESNSSSTIEESENLLELENGFASVNSSAAVAQADEDSHDDDSHEEDSNVEEDDSQDNESIDEEQSDEYDLLENGYEEYNENGAESHDDDN